MSLTLASLRSRAHLTAGAGLVLFWLTLYLFTVSPTVNFIDSGELITAAYEPGIAHPPGYPLYILMGYVATHLLGGEVAWRLNVLSSLWAALCLGAVYFLILGFWSYIKSARVASAPALSGRIRSSRALAKPEPAQAPAPTSYSPWEIAAAAGAVSLLGASGSFWSRSAQAKMYSLHFFFIALLFRLALGYRTAYERHDKTAARRWLAALVIAGSFSFTNHLMTMLLLPGLALVVFMGRDWTKRIRDTLGEWKIILPSLAPLLLYLYLPLRMAQGPYMNWGSPDSWGDFRRHVGGWQYQAYLLRDVDSNIGLILNYFGQQWGFLTLAVLASSAAAGVYFARLHSRLFMATLATAVITLLFSIIYSISEIEPYLIPIYMMLIVWLGIAAVAISTTVVPGSTQSNKETDDTWMPPPFAATVLLAVATIGAILVQYPQQDRSRDYMAPAFVRNTFSGLPDNSILITDYWDFYAPTYYLQHVKGERPDISVIDMSLLVYPWYAEQLRQYDPELLSKSEDLLSRYALEQSKWIEGQQYNESLLTSLYSDLLTSFVERNPQRRAYVLFSAPCNESQAPQGCAGNQVAPAFGRLPSGLALELVKPEDRSVVPALPEYDLRGITSERIHLDDAACLVARYYASTYVRLSRLYSSVSMQEQASKATEKANAITAVVQSSATCRRVEAALR